MIYAYNTPRNSINYAKIIDSHCQSHKTSFPAYLGFYLFLFVLVCMCACVSNFQSGFIFNKMVTDCYLSSFLCSNYFFWNVSIRELLYCRSGGFWSLINFDYSLILLFFWKNLILLFQLLQIFFLLSSLLFPMIYIFFCLIWSNFYGLIFWWLFLTKTKRWIDEIPVGRWEVDSHRSEVKSNSTTYKHVLENLGSEFVWMKKNNNSTQVRNVWQNLENGITKKNSNMQFKIVSDDECYVVLKC